MKTLDVAAELRDSEFHLRRRCGQLARFALIIEKHYDRPMDIERGKDGGMASCTSCTARPVP